MGKKLQQQKPAAAEPKPVEPEATEQSLTVLEKKANAKLLAKQQKLIKAKVLATLDVK